MGAFLGVLYREFKRCRSYDLWSISLLHSLFVYLFLFVHLSASVVLHSVLRPKAARGLLAEAERFRFAPANLQILRIHGGESEQCWCVFFRKLKLSGWGL